MDIKSIRKITLKFSKKKKNQIKLGDKIIKQYFCHILDIQRVKPGAGPKPVPRALINKPGIFTGFSSQPLRSQRVSGFRERVFLFHQEPTIYIKK